MSQLLCIIIIHKPRIRLIKIIVNAGIFTSVFVHLLFFYHRAWYYCKACHEEIRDETLIKKCKCKNCEYIVRDSFFFPQSCIVYVNLQNMHYLRSTEYYHLYLPTIILIIIYYMCLYIIIVFRLYYFLSRDVPVIISSW